MENIKGIDLTQLLEKYSLIPLDNRYSTCSELKKFLLDL